MELTVIIPLIGEILKEPGSFFEKIILIIFAAMAFNVSVRGHFKKIEVRLENIGTQLGSFGQRLDEGAKIHQQHEQRITKLEELQI